MRNKVILLGSRIRIDVPAAVNINEAKYIYIYITTFIRHMIFDAVNADACIHFCLINRIPISYLFRLSVVVVD